MAADLSRLLAEVVLARTEHRAVTLRGADLERVDLRPFANGIGFGLVEADLAGLWAPTARMAGLDLGGADLCGAYLERADLTHVNLNGALLRGAVLRGAIVAGASWSKCDLSGADCGGTGLSRAELRLQRAPIDGAQGLVP